MQLLSQEKLQNAEDAGASEVRFLLDPQSYSREKIMAPDTGKNDLARMQVTKDVLQKHFPTLSHPIALDSRECANFYISSLFQDGALFVYNDAEFTEKDWKGIRSAGSSQKKEKVDKVGRFGIGFSSVYHLTGPLSHLASLLFHLFFFRLPLDLVRNQVADDGPNPSTLEKACKDVGLHKG